MLQTDTSFAGILDYTDQRAERAQFVDRHANLNGFACGSDQLGATAADGGRSTAADTPALGVFPDPGLSF